MACDVLVQCGNFVIISSHKIKRPCSIAQKEQRNPRIRLALHGIEADDFTPAPLLQATIKLKEAPDQLGQALAAPKIKEGVLSILNQQLYFPQTLSLFPAYQLRDCFNWNINYLCCLEINNTSFIQ